LPEIVKVQFKGTRSAFYSVPAGMEVTVGDIVVVEADRGKEIGRIVRRTDRMCVAKAFNGRKAGKVVRVADQEDRNRLREMRRLEDEAKRVCQRKISEKGLQMHLVDVECGFDLNRLSIFFTAEKRVDFRELIRDMALIFHKRIKLRQIGVRDKAKRMGGFGRCGMPLCCSSFLSEFEPVTLKAAKEQNLSLNPTNISGCCGRLMCCLVYEKDFYRRCRKRFPQVGKDVMTKRGREKIVSIDIYRDRVTLQGKDGERRVIALKEFHRERRQLARKK